MSAPVIFFIFGFIIGRIRRWSIRTKSYGEAKVREVLVKYCKNKNAHVLNNITIRLLDGTTTQIDHVLVTTKGVFVIETKHYNGWIFGDPQSKKWNQTIYHLNSRFQNPLFQNYKHVLAIRRTLDFLEPQHVHNIVVFTGNGVFKTPKPDNVFYLKELTHEIDRYSDNALSLNRLQFCVGRLEYMRLELTRETDIEHHAYLTKRFGQQNDRYYNI